MPFDVLIHITEDSQRGRVIKRLARQQQTTPEQIIEHIIDEGIKIRTNTGVKADEKNVNETPTMKLMRQWLDEDSTNDPDEIREAELNEFKRNINGPRKEAGARLLYPEAE